MNGHVIHEADCPDAPEGLLVLRVSAVRDAYPDAKAHTCVSFETVRMNREVVAEPDDDGPVTP
jgi:hypothetical protein